MLVRNIIYNDFINYREAACVIALGTCDFKCGKENCHNRSLIETPEIEINEEDLVNHIFDDDLVHAIVFSGLEPYSKRSIIDIENFLMILNNMTFNMRKLYTIIIYTGYDEKEHIPYTRMDANGLSEHLSNLYPSLFVVKYGRYIPGNTQHFDKTLGVYLNSDNQHSVCYKFGSKLIDEV